MHEQLQSCVEFARELNTTKVERIGLTKKIQQLRNDSNFPERSRFFVKFPEVDGQKLAYLLATFLKDSIYELPSDTLERDLAALRPQVEVAS